MDYADKILKAAQNGEDINILLASMVKKEIEKENNKTKRFLSRDKVIERAIDDYFDKKYSEDKTIDDVTNELVGYITKAINLDNATGIHEKYRIITALSAEDLPLILPYLYTFRVVKRSSSADVDTAELMVKTKNGWYEPAENLIKRTSTKMCRSINIKRDIPEIMEKIRTQILEYDGIRTESLNQNITPLLNGIFNKKYWDEHHELMSYSDDEIIVNPLQVEFNPDATDSKINIDGDEFDVEEWLLELAANNQDVKTLLWQTLSAIMHPSRKYKKAVVLFSPFGNNGKGTFMELCRNLVGKDLCTDLPIESFKDKNLVVNLANSRLVTGDENAVDLYIDNITNFKNAVTGDPITVDRKYRNSLTFNYQGLILQCMNSLPSTKDKTNSFYRRLLPIPFNNSFEGIEKDEIKSIYIKDKRVLEYIARKALLMDLKSGEFITSEAVNNLLDEYKENNDTILQWWNDEGKDAEYVWNRLPFRFLYGSYKWWCKQNTVKGDVNLSKTKFTQEFKNKILAYTNEWEAATFNVNVTMRETVEPLVAKYNIDELKNPVYKGSDWDKIGYCGQTLKNTENGIIRKDVVA